MSAFKPDRTAPRGTLIIYALREGYSLENGDYRNILWNYRFNEIEYVLQITDSAIICTPTTPKKEYGDKWILDTKITSPISRLVVLGVMFSYVNKVKVKYYLSQWYRQIIDNLPVTVLSQLYKDFTTLFPKSKSHLFVYDEDFDNSSSIERLMIIVKGLMKKFCLSCGRPHYRLDNGEWGDRYDRIYNEKLGKVVDPELCCHGIKDSVFRTTFLFLSLFIDGYMHDHHNYYNDIIHDGLKIRVARHESALYVQEELCDYGPFVRGLHWKLFDSNHLLHS